MKESKLIQKKHLKNIEKMIAEEEESLIITTYGGLQLMYGDKGSIMAQICSMIHTLYNKAHLDKEIILKMVEEACVSEEELEKEMEELNTVGIRVDSSDEEKLDKLAKIISDLKDLTKGE